MLMSIYHRLAAAFLTLLIVLAATSAAPVLASSDSDCEDCKDNPEFIQNELTPQGGVGSFLGVRFRYVQSPPVTCAEAALGTVVILGFNNYRWQTCICDRQGSSTYDWEDFFDGGYCAWEGPV
jgi:hypothetical protein